MDIRLKSLLYFVAAILILAAMFFIPAGTLDYWQGWAYIAVTFVPMVPVMIYFLAKDPAFLERRMKIREREKEQS